MFEENVDLDAKLMVLARDAHYSDDKNATYEEGAKSLGLKGRLEALMRSLWLCSETTQEYKDKVSARLDVIAPGYGEEKDAPKAQKVIVDGQEATALPLISAKNENLIALGLEPSPELLEYMDQIAISAIEGGPLAQPFIEAGAIKVKTKIISPGVMVKGVGFHETKFAEVIKRPSPLAN